MEKLKRLEETKEFKDLENEIKKLSKKAYDNFPRQLTVDLIQRAEELINNASDIDEVDDSLFDKDTLGAYLYKISCTLEVMNPKLEDDIFYLKNIESLFRGWTKFQKND